MVQRRRGGGGRRGGGPARRGGSFSDRNPGGGRGGRSRGGYAGGRSGGDNQTVILAVLAAGGVLVIALLVILLTRGDPDPVVPETQPSEPVGAPAAGNPGPKPPKPLTAMEKRNIRDRIERIGRDYDRAKELKDKGFRAHQAQDYDRAQEYWHEAHEILFSMMEEAHGVFESYGGLDGEDRVARYLPSVHRRVGAWTALHSDILKNLR